MKVLDVQEVINGIDQLVKAKKEDAASLETIEGSIRKIHNLHSLEGEGGNAIKDHFSQLHLPSLRFFQTFIEQYIQQLETMKSYILNFETNNALVRQEFLQDTIPNGIDRVLDNAETRTQAINQACSSVSDLVYTETFGMEGVKAWADQLKNHASKTAERLEELDIENQSLASEAEATLTELINSTNKVINWSTGGPIVSQAVQQEIDTHFKENDVYYTIWSEAMEIASAEDPTLMGTVANWFGTAGQFFKGMDVVKGAGAFAVIASKRLSFERAGNGIFYVKNHKDWVQVNGKYKSRVATSLNAIMRKYGNKNSSVKFLNQLGRLNNQPTNFLRKLVGVETSHSKVAYGSLFKSNAANVALNVDKAKEYVTRVDVKETAKVAKNTFASTIKRVPLVGTVVSVGSNASELWKDENKEKSEAERTGRMAAGFGMDLGVAGLTAGGAAIGSVIMPGVGTVIGGAVGATVGIVGSLALDEKVKDLGESAGRKVEEITEKGLEFVQDNVSKVGDFVTGLFR